MTNYERWLSLTSGLSSPQNYIDWSFRYLIGASLQRRVWVGPSHQQCFPDMYVILVGRPGIGKGLAIREVSSALSYWKLKDAIKYNSKLDEVQKLTADSVLQSDIENAQSNELQASNKKNAIVDPLLIPLAADATTYEALVSAVASSYRRINYIAFDEKIQQNVLKIYGHSSLCFSLQELSSLLRARTNDTVNYLLGLYDCPEDYTYDTKTKGKDRVRRGCLNLLAGTTPSFMRSIFDSKLVDEGNILSFAAEKAKEYVNRDKIKKNEKWVL